MRHGILDKEIVNISEKECYLYVQPESKWLLIQPVDEHDLALLDKEVEMIQRFSGEVFSLIAFKIDDWNNSLLGPPLLCLARSLLVMGRQKRWNSS